MLRARTRSDVLHRSKANSGSRGFPEAALRRVRPSSDEMKDPLIHPPPHAGSERNECGLGSCEGCPCNKPRRNRTQKKKVRMCAGISKATAEEEHGGCEQPTPDTETGKSSAAAVDDSVSALE